MRTSSSLFAERLVLVRRVLVYPLLLHHPNTFLHKNPPSYVWSRTSLAWVRCWSKLAMEGRRGERTGKLSELHLRKGACSVMLPTKVLCVPLIMLAAFVLLFTFGLPFGISPEPQGATLMAAPVPRPPAEDRFRFLAYEGFDGKLHLNWKPVRSDPSWRRTAVKSMSRRWRPTSISSSRVRRSDPAQFHSEPEA